MHSGSVGRWLRVTGTLLLAIGVFYGTLLGDDDDFPFAPFKMYTDSRELDAPTPDTQAYAVNAAGDEFRLTQDLTGIRRAEIEGQLERFQADPSLLGLLAEAYEDHAPDEPPIERIRIVIEWMEIEDGVPTGESTIERVVSWQR